jgi:RNA polymerase sigma factor (sigma-70 family)
LFQRYHRAVRAKLWRCGLDGPDLDELMQAVFSVAQRRSSFVPRDDPGARRWLLDVARKEAANWRKRFQHKFEVLEPRFIYHAVAEPRDPEAHIAIVNLVHKTTALLSPEDQEILFRHGAAGETLKEIAKRLGLSKSGAHLRLSQARARFIEKLEMLEGKKTEKGDFMVLPFLAVLAAVVRRAIGPESAFARVPSLRPLLDPSRWATRLAPLFSGPLTAFLIAFTIPRQAPEQAPAVREPPPAVQKAKSSEPCDGDCAATKDAESPPAQDPGPSAIAPPSNASSGAARSDDEELLYRRILSCDARGKAEEAFDAIQSYRAKYPLGRFTAEVNMLQRKLLSAEASAKVNLAPPF